MGTIETTKGRGSGRRYLHPDTGMELPSVTTFLSVLDKPALPRWAAKMVAEYAVEHHASWSGLPHDDKVKLLRGIPWDRANKSADKGTNVHSYIEDRLLGLTLPHPLNHESEQAELILQLLEARGAKLLATEVTVVSDVYCYAGTLDAIFQVDDEKWLVDWKSSKAVYEDMRLQQAAYKYADWYVDNDGARVRLRDEHGMPIIDKCFIGHVPKEGRGGLVSIVVGEPEFKAAMAARDLWEWVNEN